MCLACMEDMNSHIYTYIHTYMLEHIQTAAMNSMLMRMKGARVCIHAYIHTHVHGHTHTHTYMHEHINNCNEFDIGGDEGC
jgi:hypothetical protein